VPPLENERRLRREFIRVHHPDRGGDPEAFRRGLASFDEAGTEGTDSTTAAARTLARAAGRWVAAVRRLPHELRGAYLEGRDGYR